MISGGGGGGGGEGRCLRRSERRAISMQSKTTRTRRCAAAWRRAGASRRGERGIAKRQRCCCSGAWHAPALLLPTAQPGTLQRASFVVVRPEAQCACHIVAASRAHTARATSRAPRACQPKGPPHSARDHIFESSWRVRIVAASTQHAHQVESTTRARTPALSRASRACTQRSPRRERWTTTPERTRCRCSCS